MSGTWRTSPQEQRTKNGSPRGANGWILLTTDKRIRYNLLEKQALEVHAVREFVFASGNMSGQDMATALERAVPKMRRVCRGTEPPFVASITRTGEVHLRWSKGYLRIKAAMSDEFIEGGDELEPLPGSERAGGPPRKLILAGVLDSQNCPRCGQRFPSKIEDSAMRKTRARDPDGWEKLRGKISRKVCTCGETSELLAAHDALASSSPLQRTAWPYARAEAHRR